ncbi:MAG: SDR family NAD(P)-dependent oxidoreductase [Magnetococcales bacterium]|nr:SDR family NAD(P)-dependent oxidoreductase [Magnetococcales bacterium]
MTPSAPSSLPSGSSAARLLNGIKLAFGLLVALPFLLLLLPLWFLYRWHERKNGQADPEAPWRILWNALSGKRDEQEWFTLPATPDKTGHSMLTPLPGAAVAAAPGTLALLTGGSSRLGNLIGADLARQGYRVIVTYYRSAERAAALVEQITAQGGEAYPFSLDQSDPEQVEQALSRIEERWGTPRLLINNASLFQATPLQTVDWPTLERLLRINLHAPLWLSIALGRRLYTLAEAGETGGQIIQLCDIWGERPLAAHTVYSTGKAGLIMATRSLARELAPLVRVNGIAPGAVMGDADDPGWQTLLRHTPLAQQAAPHAILHAIRYLLQASFVTGEILHVDGGRRLH